MEQEIISEMIINRLSKIGAVINQRRGTKYAAGIV